MMVAPLTSEKVKEASPLSSMFCTGHPDKEVSRGSNSACDSVSALCTLHGASLPRKGHFFIICTKVSLILIGWPWPCPELPKLMAGRRMKRSRKKYQQSIK